MVLFYRYRFLFSSYPSGSSRSSLSSSIPSGTKLSGSLGNIYSVSGNILSITVYRKSIFVTLGLVQYGPGSESSSEEEDDVIKTHDRRSGDEELVKDGGRENDSTNKLTSVSERDGKDKRHKHSSPIRDKSPHSRDKSPRSRDKSSRSRDKSSSSRDRSSSKKDSRKRKDKRQIHKHEKRRTSSESSSESERKSKKKHRSRSRSVESGPRKAEVGKRSIVNVVGVRRRILIIIGRRRKVIVLM